MDTQFSRKAVQLCAAIRHALSTAVGCDVDDPLFDDLYVHDVVLQPDGSYAALFATDDVAAIDVKQERLREAAPIFRRALAAALTRKRVPYIAFFVVPSVAGDGFDDDERGADYSDEVTDG